MPIRLPVEQRAVALLDGENAGLEATEERTEVEARAVEHLFVLERLVLAAEHRRAGDDVDARPWRTLPAHQAAVEPTLHAAGIARLAAKARGQIPWPDGGLAVERRIRR